MTYTRSHHTYRTKSHSPIPSPLHIIFSTTSIAKKKERDKRNVKESTERHTERARETVRSRKRKSWTRHGGLLSVLLRTGLMSVHRIAERHVWETTLSGIHFANDSYRFFSYLQTFKKYNHSSYSLCKCLHR